MEKSILNIWVKSHGLAQPDQQPWEEGPGSAWRCLLGRFSGCRLHSLFPPSEEAQVPKPAPASSPQSPEGPQPAGPETGVLDRAPIQNGPWKETSLDRPYEKPGKTSDPTSESRSGCEGGRAGSRGLQGDRSCPQLCTGGMWGPFLSTAGAPRGSTPALTCLQSFCSSPATTPQDGPGTSSLWPLEPASYHMVPLHSAPGQRQGRTSAPTTPDMQGKRGQSQSLR